MSSAPTCTSREVVWLIVSMAVCAVVFSEEIPTKVMAPIAPYRVDVSAVLLRGVQLEDEVLALDAEVVRPSPERLPPRHEVAEGPELGVVLPQVPGLERATWLVHVAQDTPDHTANRLSVADPCRGRSRWRSVR